MYIAILLALITWGCAHKHNEKLDARPSLYIADCQILDAEFNEVQFLAGDICWPTQDGGWLAIEEKKLVRYSSLGTEIWNVPGIFHHQVRSIESEFVMAMTHEIDLYQGQQVKYDVIYKIDFKSGQILKKFSLLEVFKQKNSVLKNELKLGPYQSEYVKNRFEVTGKELTHLNAISIFQNEILVTNIIRYSLVFDLDLNLKKIVKLNSKFFKNEKFDSKHSESVHDFQQIGPDRFLVFRNKSRSVSGLKSAFKILEFSNDQIVFEFPKASEDEIENNVRGGVTLVDERYLIGFPFAQDKTKSIVGLISKDGKWLYKKVIDRNIQEIKPIWVKDYLIKNRF